MRRILGQIALAVMIGCWAVALWAVFLGTGHEVAVGVDLVWWPGSTTALLVAVAAYLLLEALPMLAGPLHRAAGRDGVATWALLGGVALAAAVVLRWGAPLNQLAALELFALGMAALWVAGLSAPAPVPTAGLTRPPLATGPIALGEADDREIVWTERIAGHALTEQPYVLRARVDRAGLLSQGQSGHDLPEHRWGEYAAVTSTIRALARDVRAIAERDRLDPLEEVRLVTALVTQGLGPAEEGAPDGPLYPLETLANSTEAGPAARTILAGAILAALGYHPALLKVGDRIGLAVSGASPLPGLFFQIGGDPALYVTVTSAGSRCGDAPADVRAIPWRMLRLG